MFGTIFFKIKVLMCNIVLQFYNYHFWRHTPPPTTPTALLTLSIHSIAFYTRPLCLLDITRSHFVEKEQPATQETGKKLV